MDLRVGLFIPALETRFLQRAHERGADAIVLDLEDSVAPERKEQARAGLGAAAQLLRERGVRLICRINAEPPAMQADIEAALRAGIECLMVPKQDSAASLRAVDEALQSALGRLGRAGAAACLLPVIESPLAVLQARDIARASPRVGGLAFGGEDFSASLGLPSTAAAMSLPAQLTALAARAEGLAAFGLPGSIQSLDDAQAYGALARQARSLGFTGSICVHPAQVAPIRAGFMPTQDEIARARAIVAAAAALPGQGAYAVGGRMVDAPVVEQARRLLAEAGSPD